MSHAKVAVSIHRGPDAPDRGEVAATDAGVSRSWVPHSNNRVAFAAALVAVAAFAIYLRTMLPSTGFWDTGEAQTVPATFSIFHPTGFPLYTIVGWAWSQLPIGDGVAWRMNLLSGVCVAIAAGLVTLSSGHLIAERGRWVRPTAAGIGGAAFAFASEPWENAGRADIHAVNVAFVALIVWLLLTWAAARRAGSPTGDRWLVGAALAFGLGIAAHPLAGLTAPGIAAWLLAVDHHLWRRPRLVLTCAAAIAVGLSLYATIYLRAIIAPEPPLFYAHPDTWDRFRYLVFAEQFTHLFEDFNSPLGGLAAKWTDAERVLAAQFATPGWLVAAIGASVLAARRPGAFAFLGLVAIANVLYAMNFRDGDIDRYYLPTIVIVAPMIAIALAATASAVAGPVRDAALSFVGTRRGQRRAGAAAAWLVLGIGALLPASSLVGGYAAHDQSQNREADAWVASVYAELPPDAVIVGWWSYSTPLWYHRWVLGERPDVTIIDERNILDDGYRTMRNAIRTFFGERPVYVVPPDWEYRNLTDTWETRTVSTYPGYTDLLYIEGLRQ
jgi:hypothetical protein